MTARTILLAAPLVALCSAAVFEARVIIRQREELRNLQQRSVQAEHQAARLEQQRQAARRDLETLQRELAAGSSVENVNPAKAARQKETEAWLACVRQLKRHFDERPDQRIPEMQWLTEGDWLRVARRASFSDEHGTRDGA